MYLAFKQARCDCQAASPLRRTGRLQNQLSSNVRAPLGRLTSAQPGRILLHSHNMARPTARTWFCILCVLSEVKSQLTHSTEFEWILLFNQYVINQCTNCHGIYIYSLSIKSLILIWHSSELLLLFLYDSCS